MASVKHIVFAKATGTGTQTVTGIGFSGSAAVFWTTKQTATGIATDLRWATGLTDGTNQVCNEANWPDADGSPSGSQAESQSTVLQFRSIGGTSPVASATFGGFTSDGFELDWTVNDGSADLIHVLVVRCTEASLVGVTTTGTAGGDTQDVSVGFQPDAILWMPSNATDGMPYETSFDFVSFQAVPFSHPTAGENHTGRVFTKQANDPQSEPSSNDAIRTPIIDHSINLGLVNESIYVSGLTSDGFTLTNNSSFGVTNHTHFALCLGGITNVKVGNISPSGTGDVTVTLGFQPSVILTNSAEGVFHPASLCVGGWDAVGGQSVATIAAAASGGSTIAVRRETADAIIRTVTPSAGGMDADHNVAEIASVDDTGFVLHVTSFGGGSPQYGYLAIGSEPELSINNLLTGAGHTVQGSDNLIVGSGGTVSGDINALFALCDDSPAPEIVGDRTFKVCAATIDLLAGLLLLNGADFSDIGSLTTNLVKATAGTLSPAIAAANDTLLGSGNSGSGAAYDEITLGAGLTMTGTVLSASASAQYMPVFVGGLAMTIGDDLLVTAWEPPAA